MENKIKAVLFDFDDTLGNRDRYAYDCYRQIIVENASIDDPLLLESVVQSCMLWDQRGDVNKEYVKRMLKETYGIVLPFADFNGHWDERLWEFCVAFEDSYDTLAYLEKSYVLGLLTNGPSIGQRKKLEKSGLSRFFGNDRVFVSGDYGISKPDSRLFLEACKKIGVAPQETLYVGDNFYRDVLGAKRAGLRPVWVCNINERRCLADIEIIGKISGLKEILN